MGFFMGAPGDFEDVREPAIIRERGDALSAA
jgi:hypothetical protein